MANTDFTKGFSGASSASESGMKILFIIALCFNLLLKGGLNYFMGMVRSLQMVLHLPMMRIVVPANVITLFEYIIPIAMFDILEND